MGRQNANLINTFENTLPDIGAITESPVQLSKSAERVADKLSNQKAFLEIEKNNLPVGIRNDARRATLNRLMVELEYLSDNYRRLGNMLKASSVTGTTNVDEAEYEDIFSFGTVDQ